MTTIGSLVEKLSNISKDLYLMISYKLSDDIAKISYDIAKISDERYRCLGRTTS